MEAYLNSRNSTDAFAGSHLPVQTHRIKQKQAHHDLMSLFVSAVKMLTVISYGDYISHFSCSGPQNHWMVLPASHRRKRKNQGTIEGYCFVCVPASSRCASFTKQVAKAQKYEPSRERYRGKEALFKSFVHKIRGGGGRAAKKPKNKPKTNKSRRGWRGLKQLKRLICGENR